MSEDKKEALATVTDVELTEADIPGASLEESLEAHNVAALKWWLLCHRIKLQSSCRKKELTVR